jgi:hypothetical protein
LGHGVCTCVSVCLCVCMCVCVRAFKWIVVYDGSKDRLVGLEYLLLLLLLQSNVWDVVYGYPLCVRVYVCACACVCLLVLILAAVKYEMVGGAASWRA